MLLFVGLEYFSFSKFNILMELSEALLEEIIVEFILTESLRIHRFYSQ